MDTLLSFRPLFDLFLIHLGFAYSQYIVLRAGAFSIGNVGLSAIGAYTAAILTVNYGLPLPVTLLAGALAGLAFGTLLAIPLARLRGVYQAIASLAFVQIVLSANLYAENVTGGAMGFSGIPKLVGTGTLLVFALGTIYVMLAISRSRLGRAFDAVREDEGMAVSLGINAARTQAIAYMISGLLAGLFGSLEALHSYAVEPNQFGFHLIIVILSYVVLGGRRSVWGPLVGVALLIALPEISRPLADARIMIYGLILMVVMNFMPRGIVDTLVARRARRRSRAANPEVRQAEVKG
ncbi:branched-chain amino acid ABC transporter permease [Paracoccus siganidrum]|uniref:Branched-chain amino acid ABC transporter permease n=1 Tax=Paracoccus siganidrum TaxID=1276757 RepID=A0A419AAV0_9RHOB|nr:branched-chain amino acid ABC transporter permease [Paracoccus siganidrum]RJL20259.1 branched-chain amino acid ABC transporter permease [Paracoccus siganidrum]RMC30730.1 branched-chain amino acid ABC transporter permease [Paracoccus siganidrum]